MTPKTQRMLTYIAHVCESVPNCTISCFFTPKYANFKNKIGKTYPPPAKFEPLFIRLAVQCSTTTPPPLHSNKVEIIFNELKHCHTMAIDYLDQNTKDYGSLI